MRDGPRRFPQNFSCSAVLRCRLDDGKGFRLRGFHPLRPAFPGGSAILARRRRAGPTTPQAPRRSRFGLLRVRSPLLAQSLIYFLFLRVLRCFSSPRSPSRTKAGMWGSLPTGFPIRTPPDHRAFAPPRRFSQLVTSFVASESRGHPPRALARFRFAFFFARATTVSSGPPHTRETFIFTLVAFQVFSFGVPNMSMSSFLWRITDSNR